MAADALAVYEQDMQDVAVSPMDAAPMMLADVLPPFPPGLVAQPPAMFPPLLQPDPLFMVKAEQPDDLVSPMQLLPEDPALAYMNAPMESTPMEAIESSASLDALSYPPDIVSGAPSFALAPPTDSSMSLEISPTALSTPSPPLPVLTASQSLAVSGLSLELSPASIQAPSPPFSVVPSSLEAALIPTAPFTSPPTRASHSVSPVPISNASSQSPASIPTPYSTSASQSPTATTAASQSAMALPPAEAENHSIKDEVPMARQKKEVANLLNALANDFMVASVAVHRLEGSSEELPDELKNRIANLSRMAAQLSISGATESSPPPHSPTPPPSSVPSVPIVPVASTVPPPPHIVPSETSAHYPIHDHSLKRGPSDLDEHRSVKAMKREPQEFSLPIMAEALPLDPSAVFPATAAIPSSHAIPLAQSRPASRPPSPTNFAAAVAQYAMRPPTIYHPCPPVASAPAGTPMAGSLPPTLPAMPLTGPPAFAGGRASWSEPSVAQSRHHHSLSAGAILSPIQGMPPTPNMQMPPALVNPAIVSGPNTPVSVLPPPHVRTARSGSLSSLPFEATNYFSFPEKVPEVPISPLHAPGARSGRSSLVGTNWYFGGDNSSSPTNTSEEPGTTRNSPSDDDDDDSSSDSDDEVNPASKSTTHLPSTEGSSSSSPSAASDIPAEYRAEVDRIFFEYLNKICSNLEAKDSKGDHIHQTLMAKKMQRLDESPDFRPFKFRIQAFTTAFLEELARQGYTEDKIPMKKVRNYLWHQPHILRFNEDGKKAKSKGNHIWNVEARKLGDGRWEFRPFHRKLAGTPAAVAYVGLKWSWTPRVWDPQASFQNVPVQYSSPNLPSWLSWKDDTLSGVPPPGAESCGITVIAKYIHDGVEGQLSRTFPIAIAPVGSTETGQYPRSRRPSAASEAPRRSTSDSALCQAPARAKPRVPAVPVPIPNENASTRVIRVLQNVAQRVTEEAEIQLAPSMVPKTESLQEIVKQKHVLDQTVEAFDKEMSGQSGMESKRLAIAAQQVVIQAAANVIADRNVSIGRAPVVPNKSTAVQRVSVGELTDATHDAIAAAVKNNGTGSTEVDIIVAAASILKAKAPVAESVPPTGLPSTRTIPSMNFATNLSTLPEMM